MCLLGRLFYERDDLFEKIDDLQMNFDAELRCLRHDKFKLDVELKNADLRYVLLQLYFKFDVFEPLAQVNIYSS